jgi:predicted aldo/keto reductase-like oxidoreductase
MTSRNRIGRREFIATSAGALAAGLGSACGRVPMSEIEEAAAKVGRLPQRLLDRSGRKVSVLIGAADDWPPEVVEAGILCGVNYWHKSDKWDRGSVPQAILKNREAYYCEVAVDRVRGNHETGVIDEEAFYQHVKQALERSGLSYYDDMLCPHFGYHNTAEIKDNRGAIRAFERLKKEGLVRHLCISQHNYKGNARVPEAEDRIVILTALVEEGLYEHAQFFFSFGDEEEINKFVSFAKSKGFGTTAMKTTRGAARMQADPEFMKQIPAGTTPHHALARWLTTASNLSNAVIRIHSLDQFVDTYSGAGKPLRAADARAIEMMTAYANREVCRLCNDCMSHCAEGVAIADILRYERYAIDYGDRERARRLYAQLDKRGDACQVCGSCLTHCPQGLNIPVKLAAAHRLLS